MRILVQIAATTCFALACAPSAEKEMIVTRDQLGGAWPLQVNSARVSCGEAGAVLRIGQKRYALDPAGLAQGLPDAREVAVLRSDPHAPGSEARRADLAPLREACDGLAHVASER